MMRLAGVWPWAGEPRQLLVYYNQETLQRWKRGARNPSDEGGAMWLPGGVALELRMMPAVSRGAAADAQARPCRHHAHSLVAVDHTAWSRT